MTQINIILYIKKSINDYSELYKYLCLYLFLYIYEGVIVNCSLIILYHLQSKSGTLPWDAWIRHIKNYVLMKSFHSTERLYDVYMIYSELDIVPYL